MNLAGGFAHTVSDGPLLVAAAVAALVGLIGFLSPCVLPLVPGYLSYVAGLSGDADRPSQRRMVLGALLFVLGFTAIFVAQGAAFGELGFSITEHRVGIERVLGAVTIVMGVVFLGGIPFLQREFKFHRLPQAGLLGAPLLGAGFGLAWAPCLTPTYGAVYTMAISQGTAGRGAILTVFYCLGLGLPFVLVALGFGWVTSVLGFVRRHRVWISGVGGALLIAIGVLLLSGAWDHLMNVLRANVGSDAGFQV
ncbi:MAG: cytochrome c-type biosis protein [Pseudonocardiales bacterium]|nr:cytochrome c-type biosis protein [Pseudonocardiales bacterium]MDT4921318.1 cytochrome c-type biosis protein [Pseudonocardiales bacterium]